MQKHTLYKTVEDFKSQFVLKKAIGNTMRKTRKLGNSENILELGDMRYTERFDRSAS